MLDNGTFSSTSERRKLHAKLLREGSVVFVVGAGVSQSAGLPGWQELLDLLGAVLGETKPTDQDATRFAERLRTKAAEDGRDWGALIFDSLYRGKSYPPEVLLTAPTMLAVSVLVASAARRPGGVDVINFNYDDLLASTLKLYGLSVATVTSSDSFYSGTDVRVWHPHGALPIEKGGVAAGDLVLDRFSFAKAESDLTRQWSARLRELLTRRYGFFFGVSGDDTNLDRFLVECSKVHSLGPSAAYWGTAFVRNPTKEQKSFWKDRKVFIESFSDFGKDMLRVMLEIAKAPK